MDQLYPPGPISVDDNLAAPGPGYKRRAQVALLSLLLFIALYLSLTGWFAWTAYAYFVDASAAASSKGAFIGFGLAITAAFLSVFLIKAPVFYRPGRRTRRSGGQRGRAAAVVRIPLPAG